jgi:ribosomal-protein-alanine N-acetyltransferase
MTVRINPIADIHLEAVKAIERDCFPIPWDSRIFDTLARWQGRILLERGKVVRMDVAVENRKIVGYIVWEEDVVKQRGHLMNIAVERDNRRKGIGRLLLTHAFESQRNNGIKICELEVRESNYTAIQFYKRIGMKIAGRIPRYYHMEDAIIYSIKL